jgi:transcriptional regulator with XRE-family HTH domain
MRTYVRMAPTRRHAHTVCEHPYPPIGALLKRLREERGGTQEQLAFDARITISALSRIERGLNNPGWATVAHIARALGVSLVELGAELEAAAE